MHFASCPCFSAPLKLLFFALLLVLLSAAGSWPDATPVTLSASPAPADIDSLPHALYLPITLGQQPLERYPAANRAFELELLALINSERASAGLPALVEHPALTQAARRHATDMASHDRNSHSGSDGSMPQQRMAQEGYDGVPWTEAIVLGRASAQEALVSWMTSPPHRAIVLDSTATEIGLGCGFGGTYGGAWVIDLGARP